MMLTLPQLLGIAAILDTHHPQFPHLTTAVDAEIERLRAEHTDTMCKCGHMAQTHHGADHGPAPYRTRDASTAAALPATAPVNSLTSTEVVARDAQSPLTAS